MRSNFWCCRFHRNSDKKERKKTVFGLSIRRAFCFCSLLQLIYLVIYFYLFGNWVIQTEMLKCSSKNSSIDINNKGMINKKTIVSMNGAVTYHMIHLAFNRNSSEFLHTSTMKQLQLFSSFILRLCSNVGNLSIQELS